MPNRHLATVLACGALFLVQSATGADASRDYHFTTLAGSAGATGTADGTGSTAHFNDPTSLAVDVSGNVYVADTDNHTIRKITPAGVVTTLAGLAGSPGNANGAGAAARFNYPESVAVDSAGVIYVGESQLGTVRKITPAGVVSTLTAVTPYEGPYDLVVNAADRLYAAAGYDGIVEILPTGVWNPLGVVPGWPVLTLTADALGNFYAAGEDDFLLGAKRFPPLPLGTYLWEGWTWWARASHAIDHEGRIFAAYDNEIGLVTPGLRYPTRLAGSGPGEPGSADGHSASARFNHLTDIAVDAAGRLFVVDRGNHTIRKGVPVELLPTVISPTTANAITGRPFNYTIMIPPTDAETTYVASALPPGLVFNVVTGVISGSPTVPGTYQITIGASNSDGATSAILALTIDPPSHYIFTTLAGDASQGSVNGPGSEARFSSPSGVAVDADGNVYVSDSGNHTIRKITADGFVTSLAGTAGSSGSADSTGSAAQFNGPLGVAVDANGSVVVSDTFNSTIRKITPGGVVTTLAGSAGSSGSGDGTGSAARFHYPEALAVDLSGNIIVADTQNHTIRKITPGGVVTTLAGSAGNSGSADGTGSAARFYFPRGVTVDGSGNIIVSESSDRWIRKITPGGVVTTMTGIGDIHSVFATGLAVDGHGNIFLADRNNHAVRKITAAGVLTTFAGSVSDPGSADGGGSGARFNSPAGVAVDISGNVFVADGNNSTVRKITAGGVVTTLAGSVAIDGVGSGARFKFPLGVTLDGHGNLFVADSSNHTIRKITPGGMVTTLAGAVGAPGTTDGVGASARFNFPTGVAVDVGGNVFVTDSGNNTIRKITAAGVVTTVATLAAGPQVWSPGLAVDGSGTVFVADNGNHTIRKITAAGANMILAGSNGSPGSADGTGSTARFYHPSGVAVDRAGNIFVADAGNARVRKITATGVVTTVAVGFGTGSCTAVTVDVAGNVFFVEDEWMSGFSAIHRIDANGGLTTLAGGTTGNADGLSATARFGAPYGLAVDAQGALFVVDAINNTIRKGVLVAAEGTEPPSHLTNASIRANFVPGRRLIPGFVMSGGAKPVLVRAIGPGLAPFLPGGTTVAADPRLELYGGGAILINANDDWGAGAALRDAFTAVGAFPLAEDGADAALLQAIEGPHTAHALANSDGISLVEVYDAVPLATTGPRLINFSARYEVGGGANALILGFVIEGTGEKTVLLRGVGPSLAPFGVSSALADPKLEVFNGTGQRFAESDNWSSSLASLATQVSAFALPAGSKDAAVLLTLQPGLYTAVLTGVDGGTGEGLVEVYEVQ